MIVRKNYYGNLECTFGSTGRDGGDGSETFINLKAIQCFNWKVEQHEDSVKITVYGDQEFSKFIEALNYATNKLIDIYSI